MSNVPADPRLGARRIRRVVFSPAAIARRVDELGAEITAAYPDGELVLVGLLKGSLFFLADLARAIHRPVWIDFLVASSYGREKVSAGEVQVRYEPGIPLQDRHILVVEDIIDSGRTLGALLGRLRSAGPSSLAVCALLDKRLVPPPPELRFVGFAAPPDFLVGYGLDHAEDFRHLPYIAEVD
jgi:hypoxanthine phosphoribosyltransferase